MTETSDSSAVTVKNDKPDPVCSVSLNLIIPYEMIFKDKENKATAIRSFFIGWLCVTKGA